jgi:hypothetical protein
MLKIFLTWQENQKLFTSKIKPTVEMIFLTESLSEPFNLERG